MKIFRFTGILLIFSLSISLQAQTMKKTIATFNKAAEDYNAGNYKSALQYYHIATDMSETVGDSAADLHSQAEKMIVETTYLLAINDYKSKNYKEAITYFEESLQYAQQNNDKSRSDDVHTYLAGCYYGLGNNDMTNSDLDHAIQNFSKAATYKPEFYLAYFGLGQVYGLQGKLQPMKVNLDKTISLAGDDFKTITSAQNTATSAFQKAGAMALQANKFDDAVKYLVTSQDYNNSEPRTWYYLAISYNGLGKWDNAISSAKKALELTTGDKFDIYYELGRANEGKGNKSSACENYKKVTGGSHAVEAKYRCQQVLKCL
jgi:tetratricopeptide (TPR) repeat protein